MRRPQSAGPGGRPQSAGRSVPDHEAYSYGSSYSVTYQQQQLTKMSQNRTSPKWTFGGRHGAGARPGTPGPGSYDRGGRSGTPSYGFGTSSRDGQTPSGAPGPGQYKPQSRPRSAAPTYRFGTSPRGGNGSSFTPGPGAYQPNFSSTRQSTPQYTATPRRDSVRSYTGTPGPGSYGANASKDSPSWGFGTESRDNRAQMFGPGPGAYHVHSVDGGPSYSMRHRSDYAGPHFDTPGPGAHAGMYTQFGY
mmetsp:Transcript_102751/g.257687  ORF Transcript_102751/g.257687 Transcript_102751/m.257687 type:complete len:248 (+) Transcript_102751:110-853(+)